MMERAHGERGCASAVRSRARPRVRSRVRPHVRSRVRAFARSRVRAQGVGTRHALRMSSWERVRYAEARPWMQGGMREALRFARSSGELAARLLPNPSMRQLAPIVVGGRCNSTEAAV